MNERLLEIIKYKTGGKQTEFAASLGWSPQYLAKLLKGDNFGIRPVVTIITAFPEINARWLLVGDGDMIENPKYSDIRKTMHENMIAIIDIEKYMIVMSPAELREFEQVVAGRKKADFSPDLLDKWERQLLVREYNLNAKFTATKAKSDKICKQKKASK